MAFAQVVTQVAVVIPFLLLPSSRSLHVMENGHELHKTLIFGTHHKTGTELAKAVSPCFESSFKITRNVHFEGGVLSPHEKVLHLARNPISLTLSAYLYHKETGEPWTMVPGGPEMDKVVKADPYLRKFWKSNTECYTEFLRRVDTRVGIQAEMNRLGHSNNTLNEMVKATRFCGERSRCMQLCLEDFTASSSSYDASWRKVLDFLGEHVTPQMKQCLSKSDLNRNVADQDHVTSNRLSKSRYYQLRKIVAEVDAKAFNGRLKHMEEGRFYCGGHSKLFKTQTGANYTDDGGYAEWLIAEEYSKPRGL